MGWISQQKGSEKENIAYRWLKKQNIKVLCTNFNCKGGEIDIIGINNEQTLIFFEVKYRKNTKYGHAIEYISPSKQKKIITCAKFYLAKNQNLQDYNMRFDAITFHAEQTTPEWHKDIFWLN